MTCSATQYDFLVTSAPGLTELLTQELAQLSLKVTPEGKAAVALTGSLEDGLRVCLYSRLAERVLCRLVRLEVTPDEAPTALAAAFDWQTHLACADALHVAVNTRSKQRLNGLALSRDFIAAAPQRLTLSAEARGALTLQLFITDSHAELSVDLSGEPLQRRGYRLAGGKAPLRETLAAAMLQAAGWQGETPLLDPFCGSGTILIEAAMLARRMAPGLNRKFFGFTQWAACPLELWPRLCLEAEEQERPLPKRVSLKGFDADNDSLKFARANAERAGVADCIHFERRELGALRERDFADQSVVVSNPPWGERLETQQRAAWLHAALGQTLSRLAPGSQATLLGARVDVLDRCGMQLLSQHTLLNGAEKNWMRRYQPRPMARTLPLLPQALEGEVEEEASAFYNRLLKNAKQLKRWLRDDSSNAWRLYDRDLPEFNFTIDIYADKLLVQEWKAPKKVDEAKVKARRQLALKTLRLALGCHREQVFLRTRERQKGRKQYHQLAQQQRFFQVREGRASLLVNLEDYHDSGLFLDHRKMRLRLAQEAAGKRFLNLFCYTGSATVQAALGGAKSSISVDSSKRYLDWAANNLALNGYSSEQHQLVCADVRRWLADHHDAFDIIFCDPPTFSNSKSRDDWVVQRDHGALIELLMKKLDPAGVLYFSCNFRGFELDSRLTQQFEVKDITQQTLDPDAALHQSRHASIHHCFELRHARA